MPSRELRVQLLWGVQSLKMLREGLASCWYAVPHKLKLIRDMTQQVATVFETQPGPAQLIFLLNGSTLLPDSPISLLRDGDQLIVHPHPSWWQQQEGPLLLGAPGSAQLDGAAGSAPLQLMAPAAAATTAAAAAPAKAAGKAAGKPGAKAAALKGRQTKRAERVPPVHAAAVPGPSAAAAKKPAAKRKRDEEQPAPAEASSSSESSSSEEFDSSDESAEKPAPQPQQQESSSSEESSSEESSSEEEEDEDEPQLQAPPATSQPAAATPMPAAVPAPGAKASQEPPRPSRSARRKKQKRQLKRMGLLPAKSPPAHKRKAEPPAEEDAAPAKAAAGQQLSAKGLPKRGDEGHRRMPLKQHIVFDDPAAQAGPPASSSEEGSSSEDESNDDAAAKDSQAGRRTVSGGTVDEQVARLQAAEEASSEEDRDEEAVKTAQNRQITDFEALPRLQRHPMYGDVLAYRLLEIAANFTPQVAEWRLGSVNSWNVKTQATVLYPWPNVNVHPVKGAAGPSAGNDVMEEDQSEEEEGPPSAYDEQGVLTAEAAAFSDLRLAQAASDAPPNSPDPRAHASAGQHAGGNASGAHPPATAMNATQELPSSDRPGALMRSPVRPAAGMLGAPSTAAVAELAAAGLVSPDPKRPASRQRQQEVSASQAHAPSPTIGVQGAPSASTAPSEAQPKPVAPEMVLRQVGNGPPVADLPVKLPATRPGSTASALGAWSSVAGNLRQCSREQ
ncbi:hypothetical protein WJX84_002362 [Apatococcus fuscideae]|uniref:Coilin tudor domain-containing protein n=1 Tax=Apatococcus fuscideae TaxID=2026836 RepID=A0AAW1T343_9CHLO